MKRIIWIVNTIMPKIARSIDLPMQGGGSWLNEPLEYLAGTGEFEISVVTMWHRRSFVHKKIDNVDYYILPGNYIDEYWGPVGAYKKKCRELVASIRPDIVHIFGGEFAFALGILPYASCPTVLTVQGFISVINRRYYYGGIKVPNLLMTLMPWNIRTFLPMVLRHYGNRFRARSEVMQVKKSDIVIGNTSWDYTQSRLMNPDSKYISIDYAIRHNFLEYQWDLEGVKRHSILFVNMSVPLKGFHTLLEAAAILYKKYPDMSIRVAGGVTYRTARATGYANYLRKKVKQSGLDHIVEDLGVLDGDGMARAMSTSHVFTLSSCIENGPNVLLEAMLVGTPCVSSYVGGAMDYAKDKEEALFYRFDEPEMLAHMIETVWENDDLANELSRHARTRARARSDFQEASKEIEKLYNEI